MDSVPVIELPIEVREERLFADILEFNVGPVPLSYCRMAKAILELHDCGGIGVAEQPIPNAMLSMWFADAWSIVRSMHTLAQLSRSAPKGLELDLSPHTELLRSCSLMRNGLDHLVSNSKNLAKRTAKAMSPILGTLTAVIVPNLDPSEPVNELHHVAVTRTIWHHRYELQTVPPDEELFPFTGRISRIRLHAFDAIVDLSVAAGLADKIHAKVAAMLQENQKLLLNVIVNMRGAEPFDVNWSRSPETE